MKNKYKLMGIITFLSLSFFSSLTSKKSVISKAETEESLTLTSMIGEVYNNSLGLDKEIENDYFSYSLKYGTLSTNNFKLSSFDNKKEESGNKIISSISGKAKSEWNGIKIYSLEDERFIVKIVPKQNITIHTYLDTLTLYTAGADNCFINYYVKSSSYKENHLINSKKTISIDAARKIADYDYSFTLFKGQIFYWEFGFQWSGWHRNWMIGESAEGKTNYTFAYSLSNEKQKETFYMSNMVKEVLSSKGEDVVNTTANYNIKHGNICENYILDYPSFSSDNLLSQDSSSNVQNWRIRSKNNDGIIFQFEVNEYSTFSTLRRAKGTDWFAGAYLNIYINNVEVYKYFFESEEYDLSIFSFSSDVKIGDLIQWQFSFAGTDNYRILAMQNDGDILSSLPEFKFEIKEHEHNFFTLINGKTSDCENNGYKNYYSCECGLFSEDQLASALIGNKKDLEIWKNTLGKGLIPALGHKYETINYSWSDDYSSCTASSECLNCDKIINETASSVIVSKTESDCSKEGITTYEVTFTNNIFQKQTKIVISAASKHNLLLIPGLSPTCEDDGYKDYYKCTNCGLCFSSSDGKEVIFDFIAWSKNEGKISALSHALGDANYVWLENHKKCMAFSKCTRDGCDYSVSETVEALKKGNTYTATFTNSLFITQIYKVKKNNALPIILPIVGVVILSGGFLTYFLLRKKKNNFKK